MLILTIPLFVLFICIIIHFHQHYGFRSWRGKKRQSLRCCWCCKVKNDQEFGFFPSAFLLYMLLITMTSILIMYRYLLHEHSAFTLLIYTNHLNSFHENLSTNTFTQMTSLHLASSYVDWCIYGLILVLILWDSLFSFYRYYSTKMLTQYYYDALTLFAVLKPFTIYAIISITLFVIQTQMYYYLFPLVVLSYSVANMYWIANTSRFIVESIESMNIGSESTPPNRSRFDADLDTDLVHDTILMRNLTVLSSLCSSTYIAAFTVMYHMDIVYYFPFMWSVSVVLFAFNFVRNRQYIKHILSKVAACTQVSAQNQDTNASNFVVHVENIDKNKAPVSICISDGSSNPNPINLSVPCNALNSNVRISLPPIHEPGPFMRNKSYSTGNLLVLLQKTKPDKSHLTPLATQRSSATEFPTLQFGACHSERAPSSIQSSSMKQMQCLTTPRVPLAHSSISIDIRCSSTPMLEGDYDETLRQYDFSKFMDTENPTPVPSFNSVGSRSVPIVTNSKLSVVDPNNHYTKHKEKGIEVSMSKSFLNLFVAEGFCDKTTRN